MRKFLSRCVPVLVFFLPLLLASRFQISLLRAEGDDSRSWAITTALLQKMRFGVDVVFSHGPLMFLTDRVFPICPIPGFHLLFQLVNRLIVGGTILGWMKALNLKGLKGLAFGLTLTGLIGCAEIESEAGMLMVCVALAMLFLMGRGQRLSPIALGAITALSVMIKSSLGIATLVTCLIALLRWTFLYRRLEVPFYFVFSFFTTLLGVWTAIGQRVFDLPAYFLNSSVVVKGYPYYLGKGVKGEWGVIIGYFLVCVIFAVLARRYRSRDTTSFAILSAFPLLISFKHSIVRMGPVHIFHFVFFGFFCVGLLLWLIWRAGSLRGSAVAWSILLVGLLQFSPAFTRLYREGAFSLYSGCLLDFFVQGVPRSLYSIHHAISSSVECNGTPAWDSKLSHEKLLPESIRNRIGKKTVDVWSDDLSWVFINQFQWAPRPTVTRLLAAAPAADKMDNEFLTGERASEVIVLDVNYTTMDGIYDIWSEPVSFSSIMSLYAPMYFRDGVLLLERSPRPRLSPARVLGRNLVKTGEWLKVPFHEPGELVFASIKANRTIAERVQSILVRPSRIRLTAKKAHKEYTSHFMYSNSELGLLMGALPDDSEEMRRFFCDFSGSEVESIRFENSIEHLVANDFEVTWLTRAIDPQLNPVGEFCSLSSH